MTIRNTTLAAAILFAAACGGRADGAPEIVVDRTACSHCGMLVSELVYAAAYQVAGADARVFDDLGCLRKAARGERTDLRVWVHDATTGAWIDGRAATFVSSAEIRTPMGGGILAYRDPADADRAARKFRGRIIRSLSSLLDTKESAS
jgi:nitrous oxide reductase accessory protein NosL